MPSLSVLFEAYLAEYLALEPVHATVIGDHSHDGEWPLVGEAGRVARLAFADRWTAGLDALAEAELTADDAIDRDLLRLQVGAIRHGAKDLREETWDPLSWVYLLGDGLFPLLAREFAPLADRLASATSRIEAIPPLLDVAKATLTGTPGGSGTPGAPGGSAGRGTPGGPVIPLSRFHAERAVADVPGVAELIDETLASAEASAGDDPRVAVLLPRLRPAAARAKTSLEAFAVHLRDRVVPIAEGEGRLGRERFETKLRVTCSNDQVTPEEVLRSAERAYAAVRAEMIRLAREIWPSWRPAEPVPADDGAAVRGVLDAIAADHPQADELLDVCRAELGRIEAFCTEQDLIGLADEPLQIQWTPAYLRSFGGAMLSSPGPLDRGEATFFSITPVPGEWPEDRRESYLREDNRRMLRLLTIHEAVPGHYLQGVYGNRAERLVRSVFGDVVFAEGWAVYVTQVVMDRGFGHGDPALWLSHWKFFLRSITNAIIDVRIHCDGMTETEAVDLMVRGGFQEEAEARAKYDRARLSSTQLSTYFLGSEAMWDLELERRRRLAIASGDPRGEAAVPSPTIVGGIGDTPGFLYREHLEEVLRHGELPIPLLRRVLLP